MKTDKVGDARPVQPGGGKTSKSMIGSIYSPFTDGHSYLTSMLESKPAKGVCLLGKIAFDIFIGSWFRKEKTYNYQSCPCSLEPVEWNGVASKVAHNKKEGDKAFVEQFKRDWLNKSIADDGLLQKYNAASQHFKNCLEFCIETVKSRPIGGQLGITFPMSASDILNKNIRNAVVYNAIEVYLLALEREEFEQVNTTEESAPPVSVGWWQTLVNWWYGG